jgi:predicted dehydrogenase
MAMSFDPAALRQTWPMPSQLRPIVTIGAGSIVADAHFPAYRKAGFPIAGLYDLDAARAGKVATAFGVKQVFSSLAEALAVPGAVFDLATPPGAHAAILSQVPDGATVLIQKPMGRDLAEASDIFSICRAKRLIAAVNFQLRFAPMMLAVRDAIEQGLLGRLVDVEVHLAVDTPWHHFAFMKGLPRIEIALHSIHYLDLIRSFLGDPLGIHAKTIGHPASDMAQTRTSAILDYGSQVRCTLSINHNHGFGRQNQVAEFRFDGTEGAAHVKLGLLLDYPHGESEELWIRARGEAEWRQVSLAGACYPDAFVGRMANLQRFASGEDAAMCADVADSWATMALVESAYASSAAPATPIARLPPR